MSRSRNIVKASCQVVSLTLAVLVMVTLLPRESSAQFDDEGWKIQYQENFDSPFEAADGQTFGTDDWLIFQLINGGTITVANGYAQLNAPDFWNAALIRSTAVLPDEYKVRTRIGYINYDLANYEQADFDDPDFNDHGGNYENGMYFLTITNDTCSGNQCAEGWWHYHRKMVIDIDNHLESGGGEVFHPVYMVYMASETNVGGNLLRTWDGVAWDESPWNWNVAYTYAYDTWYYAELEKKDGHITLRLYDESQNLLEEPPPVPFNQVFAMDEPDFLYVGEPHTDDYEGDVRIDEITLLVVDDQTDADDPPGDNTLPSEFSVSQNYPNPFNPTTTISFSLPEASDVQVDIFNVVGQKVASLLSGPMAAGEHQIQWNGNADGGRAAATGVYLYRIRAGDRDVTRKMLLLK